MNDLTVYVYIHYILSREGKAKTGLKSLSDHCKQGYIPFISHGKY